MLVKCFLHMSLHGSGDVVVFHSLQAMRILAVIVTIVMCFEMILTTAPIGNT